MTTETAPTMLVNRDRFLNAIAVLDRMAGNARMSIRGAEQILAIFPYLKDVYEPLHSQREAIFETYGTKDENGKLMIRGGEFVVPPSKQKECQTKLKQWAAGGVEVPMDILARLNHVEFTAMELRAIQNGLKPQDEETKVFAPKIICSGRGEIINQT